MIHILYHRTSHMQPKKEEKPTSEPKKVLICKLEDFERLELGKDDKVSLWAWAQLAVRKGEDSWYVNVKGDGLFEFKRDGRGWVWQGEAYAIMETT